MEDFKGYAWAFLGAHVLCFSVLGMLCFVVWQLPEWFLVRIAFTCGVLVWFGMIVAEAETKEVEE